MGRARSKVQQLFSFSCTIPTGRWLLEMIRLMMILVLIGKVQSSKMTLVSEQRQICHRYSIHTTRRQHAVSKLPLKCLVLCVSDSFPSPILKLGLRLDENRSGLIRQLCISVLEVYNNKQQSHCISSHFKVVNFLMHNMCSLGRDLLVMCIKTIFGLRCPCTEVRGWG